MRKFASRQSDGWQRSALVGAEVTWKILLTIEKFRANCAFLRRRWSLISLPIPSPGPEKFNFTKAGEISRKIHDIAVLFGRFSTRKCWRFTRTATGGRSSSCTWCITIWTTWKGRHSSCSRTFAISISASICWRESSGTTLMAHAKLISWIFNPIWFTPSSPGRSTSWHNSNTFIWTTIVCLPYPTASSFTPQAYEMSFFSKIAWNRYPARSCSHRRDFTGWTLPRTAYETSQIYSDSRVWWLWLRPITNWIQSTPMG